MLDPAEHDSSPWSTFSTRKKAGTIIGATIGVITLIVALYVAVRALLRRRRTSAGRGARGGAMGPYTHGQGNEGSRRWHGGGRGHGLWGITGRKLGTCSSSREKVAEVSGSKRTAELQDTTVVEMPANEVVR